MAKKKNKQADSGGSRRAESREERKRAVKEEREGRIEELREICQDEGLVRLCAMDTSTRKEVLVDLVRLGVEERQRAERERRPSSPSDSPSDSLLKKVYDSAPKACDQHDTVRVYFDPDNEEHSFLKERLLCVAAQHGHYRTITHLIDNFNAAKSLVSEIKSDTRHGVPGKRCPALDFAYDAQNLKGMKREMTIDALLKGWGDATDSVTYEQPACSRFKTSPFMLPYDKTELETLFREPRNEHVKALDKLVEVGYLNDRGSNDNGGATE